MTRTQTVAGWLVVGAVVTAAIGCGGSVNESHGGGGNAQGSTLTGETGGAGGTTTSTTSSTTAPAPDPVTLAANLVNPRGMFVAPTDVYWSEWGSSSGQGAIKSVAKDGSGSPKTIVSGLTSPEGIWVDGGYVYWTDKGGQNGSRVARVALGGGAVEVLFASADDAKEVVVAKGNLYYNGTAEGVIVHIVTSSIGTVSPSITVFATLQNNAGHLTSDGTNLIWTYADTTSSPTGIRFQLLGTSATTATAANVYSTKSSAQSIDALATDSAKIYFTEYDGTNTTVYSIALGAQGAPQVIATLPNTDSAGIAVDGSNVFYTEYDTGEIASPQGLPAPVSSQSHPTRITVESNAIYWMNWGNPNGAIMRLAR
jgi:hypothetical protein